MPRINWLSRAICAAVVCASLVSAASANFVEFWVERWDQDGNGVAYTYGAGIEIQVTGATAVEMVLSGGGTAPFVAGPSGFWFDTSDGVSLATLNSEIGGAHTVRITHAGADSVYQYTRAVITDGLFPNLPTLDAVPANIEQDHNFQWAWAAGSADEMWADAEIYNKLYKESESIDPFEVGTTTSWAPDFAPETGDGEFIIGYTFVGDVKAGNGISISAWTRDSGDELFGGVDDEIEDFVDSLDIENFTVVPEPTTLLVMACGAIGLLRRRRSKIRRGGRA
ncbi:hypothetical protein LCGC14_0253840 [marine sediment metagenome]|uniref:Ice-binding protein C-terminal domain-containing protein n=1 Tax=marine sediment metagenome TaxID=412755 RepID=A0A0F9X8D9_9ZZZZ